MLVPTQFVENGPVGEASQYRKARDSKHPLPLECCQPQPLPKFHGCYVIVNLVVLVCTMNPHLETNLNKGLQPQFLRNNLLTIYSKVGIWFNQFVNPYENSIRKLVSARVSLALRIGSAFHMIQFTGRSSLLVNNKNIKVHVISFQ